jgi:SAM-dependent methyltransferase
MPVPGVPGELQVLPDGLVLSGGLPVGGPLDVHINGRRVWSPSVEAGSGPVELIWPPALLPYLDGSAAVELRSPADGALVAAGTGRLGRSDLPVSLVDDRGRRLVVTKWGNVGVSIEGADEDLTERMLTRATALIDDLRVDGWIPFIVGGTLLGAARSGNVLPHDDDIDLAVLLPEGSNPADLVLESFRLQRMLEARGYVIVRHSAAHLQITFLFDGGVTDHYIDIFLAWYRDGWFYEPLAMQVPAAAVSIEPLRSIRLGGRDFPAPADVDGWLAACYGPGWRTPDPSFRFDVPLRTRRRFWTWFGNFNLHRTYWTRPGAALSGEAEVTDALLAEFPAGGLVVDLGSGDGAASRRFAEAGHQVLAVDFEFLAIAAAEAVPGVRARRVNLNDDSDVLDLAVELISSGRTVSFYAGHTYEGLSGEGKRNVLRLLRWTMSPESVAVFDCWSELPDDFLFEDPTTWHVEFEDLEHDAAIARCEAILVDEGSRLTPHGQRQWLRARMSRRLEGETR